MTIPFTAAVDRYYAESWAGTKDGPKSRRRALAFAECALAGSSLTHSGSVVSLFTPALAFAARDRMRESGLSPATVNRHVAAFCGVWRACYRRCEVDKGPPEGLYLREGPGRTRTLNPREFEILLRHLHPKYKALAVFLYDTGARVSEALRLDGPDTVQGTNGAPMVLFRDTKNGDSRTVPVSARVFAHLREVDGRSAGPFAHIQQRAFNGAWVDAVRKAGFKGTEIVPHALRHSYATRLVAAGVPLLVVSRLLGHRSTRTTERYAHVSSEMQVDCLRKAGII